MSYEYSFEGFNIIWSESRPVVLPPEGFTPSVIIDLGSWIGETTEIYANRYPEAKVVGVELDPENAVFSKERLAPFGDRVEIINAAVWTCDGTVEWYKQASETSHLANLDCLQKISIGGFKPKYRADAISLDSLTSPYKSVDFIKWDIEGAEYDVIKSPGEWISKTKYMIVESHHNQQNLISELLKDLGFNIVNREWELILVENTSVK